MARVVHRSTRDSICLSWMIVLTQLVNVFAITVHGAPTAPPQSDSSIAQRNQRINAAFKLTTGDIAAIQVQDGPDQSLIANVQISGRSCTMRLFPRSVRAPGYQLLAQIEGGGYVPVDPGPSRTYWGGIDEHPGSVAAGSRTAAGELFATVRLGVGQQYWIEPVSSHAPGEDPSLSISYRTEDVAECIGVCGTDERHRIAPASVGHSSAFAGGAPTICAALLACDADHEYYVAYGSVNAVNDRIEQVINSVNVEYSSEVGIMHTLGTVIVRTVEPDPYSSTNADTLLDQFVNQWRNHHTGISRNACQLFTGKNLNGSTIGLAYIGAVCDSDFGYSLVQSDFNATYGCVTDLSAHELGHNWNAQHCACSNPPYTMNPFNVCANHFHPTLSIPVIVAYRDVVSCLSCGPLLELKINGSGSAAGEQFGRALAVVNDVNSDGEPDYVVGCPENDENGANAGKIYVLSGADGSVLWSKRGSAAGGRFGYSVAACGTKIIVGAPYYDGTGTDSGRIYVYNAVTGALLTYKSGHAAGDRFGWSVAGGVDVNNDGQPDYLVGAPYYNSSSSVTGNGMAYVFNGATYALLRNIAGEKAGDHFGWSVALLAKANGDAYGDFVVGAPYNDDNGASAGKVYVYSGQNWALLYPALKGAHAGDQFGRCVASIGKVNSDTRTDFAVGAPYYDNGSAVNAGRVSVHSGSSGSLIFAKNGAAANDQFGAAISTAGDADLDGRNDLMVGAPRNDANATDAGKVYVYSGRNGSLLAHFEGEAAGDRLGSALAGWGGANACRLAMAATLNDGSGANAGRAYVYGTPASGLHSPITGSVHSPCVCDLSGPNDVRDGAVDVYDLLAVLNHWSDCHVPCPPACLGDVNHNCVVGVDDLLEIINQWGPCP